MPNTNGHFYYLGKDKKEYFTREDADKYGGGAIKRRWHTPIKEYQEIPYDELDAEAATPAPIIEPETDVLLVPEGIMEFDQLDVKEMREILKRKGVPIQGNQSRETLLAKLKSFN